MCSRTRAKDSSLENAGSVKLNHVLKFVVAEMSSPVVDCRPMLRWQHHTRMRCRTVASGHRQTRRRATASCHSPHQKSVDATRTLQIMWPSAASPSTRNNTLSMPGSRVVSFFDNKPSTNEKKRNMWANAKDDENERRKAQVLHCFIFKRNVNFDAAR